MTLPVIPLSLPMSGYLPPYVPMLHHVPYAPPCPYVPPYDCPFHLSML